MLSRLSDARSSRRLSKQASGPATSLLLKHPLDQPHLKRAVVPRIPTLNNSLASISTWNTRILVNVLSRDNHSDNGVSKVQSSSQINLDAYVLQSFCIRLEKLPAASDIAAINSECGNRQLLALPNLGPPLNDAVRLLNPWVVSLRGRLRKDQDLRVCKYMPLVC